MIGSLGDLLVYNFTSKHYYPKDLNVKDDNVVSHFIQSHQSVIFSDELISKLPVFL